MSAVNSIYHIVINTYRREMTIPDETSEHMYRYIWSIINSRNCKLYRIGGMPDHLHLFVSLPANLSMSKFVQELKIVTSKWLKANPHFPLFGRWSKEYAGFSYNLRDKNMIVGYIAKQKEHHRRVTFAEEYRQFLIENAVDIKKEYFLTD